MIAPTHRLIEEFVSLVRIDSEGPDCGAFREHLAKALRERFGLNPIVQKTAESANLLVRVPGVPGLPPILLCAHMDTVGPGKGIKPVVLEDRITSDGTTILGADNKAAIAVFLQFLEVWKKFDLPIRPLEILFTYGEESGLLGARALDPSLIHSREGLCFDAAGPFGRITVAGPWYNRYEVVVHGRSSHAGIAPDQGINAIQAAAFLILSFPNGRVNATTTGNVGTVRGGRQNNIVPDEAVFTGELRSLDPAQIDRWLGRMNRAIQAARLGYGVEVDFNIVQEFQGFRFGRNDPLLKAVRAAMRRVDIEPVSERHNGGSDANILNALGIRTLNLSVGMENVHSTSEYIRIEDLEACFEFLYEFLIVREQTRA